MRFSTNRVARSAHLLGGKLEFRGTNAEFGRAPHILCPLGTLHQRRHAQRLLGSITRLWSIAIRQNNAGAKATRIKSQIDTERPGADYAKVRRCGHEPDSAAG